MRIYPKVKPFVKKTTVVEEVKSVETKEAEVVNEENVVEEISAAPKKTKKKNILLEEDIED